MHPVVLRQLTVARTEELGPRMRRLILAGDELGSFRRDGFDLPAFVSESADDHVKLIPPRPDGTAPALPVQGDGKLMWPEDRGVVHRDYTVRRFDPVAGELTIDVVVHDGGVVSSWAVAAAVGDSIHVAGPRSSVRYPSMTHLVLAGDLTGLPAIARWVEEVSEQTTLTVLIRATDERDQIPLTRNDGSSVPVTWLFGDQPLSEAVASLEPFDDDVFVFVAAESADAAAIRTHIRSDRGLAPSRFKIAGYWTAGD